MSIRRKAGFKPVTLGLEHVQDDLISDEVAATVSRTGRIRPMHTRSHDRHNACRSINAVLTLVRVERISSHEYPLRGLHPPLSSRRSIT